MTPIFRFSVCLLLALLSSVALSNPGKARTEYQQCLAELATEQRALDQISIPMQQRCDNTGICIEVTIGSGSASELGSYKAFIKGDECMGKLQMYEEACEEADEDCVYMTFDRVYGRKPWDSANDRP